MPNRSTVTLPDFRNLAVLLRVALGVQLLGLMAAVVKSASLTSVMPIFLDMAGSLEPPFMMTFMVLFAASPWLQKQAYPRGVAVVMASSVVTAVLWQVILGMRYPDADQGSLMRTTTLAAAMAFLLLGYFNWRHRALSPALAEARLQALQSRIRPHFLYNSLNTVLSLMRSAPKQAEEVLENLADLFRVHMADNRQLSPLSRELELAHSYIHLEEIRLGERLRMEWRVDNAPADALIPPLVLQPLLENAVYYGVEPSPEPGTVHVGVFSRDRQLNLVVRNPVHETAEKRSGSGMALSNIRERLALHFDVDARLTTHSVGGEFMVHVVMPLRRGTSAEHA